MVRRINLVPPGERRRTQTDPGLLIAVVVAMLAVGAMGMTYFRYSGQLSDAEATLAELQMQNQQIAAQLATLAPYSELENQRQTAEMVAQHVYEHRTLISEVLGDISLVVPDNVWFKELSVEAPDIPVAETPAPEAPAAATAAAAAAAEGGAPAPAAPAPAPAAPPAMGKLMVNAGTYTFEDVSRFLVRLQQVPSLKDVTLGSAETDTEGDLKATTVEAGVINAQPLNTKLPIALVEVEG